MKKRKITWQAKEPDVNDILTEYQIEFYKTSSSRHLHFAHYFRRETLENKKSKKIYEKFTYKIP